MFQERGLSLETAPEGNIFCVSIKKQHTIWISRGNCPKPRRLILRKVRRKLFQNERDRLQERRNELRSDSEYDIYTNDLRTEAPEVSQGGNGIEAAQEENSQQGYAGDSAIEKLKSLSMTKGSLQ